MRNIEFRGIVKEKGMSECWIKGSLLHITKTYKGEEDEQECDIYQIITEDGVGSFIDKNTIGQYTGLHDKNGQEIYEGDIISDGYEKCLVVWVKKYAGFMLKLLEEKNDFREWSNPFIDLGKEDEVIGNIYENPELLEEEK